MIPTMGSESIPKRTRRGKVTMSLLNKAKVKVFILETAGRTRASDKFTRVSKDCFDTIEARIRNMIRDELHRHPSIGKTIKF